MALQFNHKSHGSLVGSGSYQFRQYCKYPITYNFTGCDSNIHPTSMQEGETITLTMSTGREFTGQYMTPRPNKNPVTVTNATFTYTVTDYTYSTIVISNPTGPVTINMTAQLRPTTGQLITMTLGNTAEYGTNNLYRVMQLPFSDGRFRVWGPTPVMAMFDYKTAVKYSTTGSSLPTAKYFGGGIDTALNTDFYNELSDEAKNAIYSTWESTWFKGQYAKLRYSTAAYDVNTHASEYSNSLDSLQQITSVGGSARYVFAPSYYYIFMDYYWSYRYGSNNFNAAQLAEEFYHQSSLPTHKCLFTDHGGDTGGIINAALFPVFYNSRITKDPTAAGFQDTAAAKPCFWIDLSKVDWEFVNE